MGLGYAIPAGWGTNWRAARNSAGTTRTEVPIFGDSTTWGSQALYSWVQRLRDRSVAAGYADGGKGVFGVGEDSITYDTPEINGLVSNGWTWVQDAADTDVLGGGGYSSNTSGEALTVQGRVVGSGGEFRLWYVNRDVGTFTVAIDGGAATTVTTTSSSGSPPAFYRVTGLAAGNHTAVITNTTTGSHQIVAPAFMNGSGVVYHKYAVSGQVMLHYFDPLGRMSSNGLRRDQHPQALLGLTVGNGGTSLSWQQPLSSTAGRPSCSLAILHLGFNDMTGMPTNWDPNRTYNSPDGVIYGGVHYKAQASNSNSVPPSNATNWAVTDSGGSGGNDLDNYCEAIHLFCRMAQAAGADPLVISGEFLMNANAYTLGGRMSRAVRETALACGAAWCDFMMPALGKPNAITGLASTNNPHLNKPGYVAQADFLWNNVLSV
jgi:hypothetical protein